MLQYYNLPQKKKKIKTKANYLILFDLIHILEIKLSYYNFI